MTSCSHMARYNERALKSESVSSFILVVSSVLLSPNRLQRRIKCGSVSVDVWLSSSCLCLHPAVSMARLWSHTLYSASGCAQIIIFNLFLSVRYSITWVYLVLFVVQKMLFFCNWLVQVTWSLYCSLSHCSSLSLTPLSHQTSITNRPLFD